MILRWLARLPGDPLGLLVPLYLIGTIVLVALTGITPWRSVALGLEGWPPLRLVGFWSLLAAAVVAAYGFLTLARGLVRKTNEPWPWTAVETGVALVVTLVAIGISSETLPANFIKAGGFQLLLPILMVVGVAVTREHRGRFPAGLLRALLAMGGVTFAYLIFNLSVTGDVPRGALLLNRLWAYGAWFLLLGLVLHPGPGLDHLRSFLIALGLGVTGYGILQHFGLDWAQWGRGFSLPELKVPGRAMSSFGNPNFYGAFLVVILPLVIGRYLTAAGRRQLLVRGAALAIIFTGLLFTYNRAGYLAAGVALGLLLWRLPAHRRRLWLLLGVLALGFLAGPASVRDRMLFWRNGLSGDDQIRAALWRATMNMALDRPLLGHGVGSFNQSATRYLPYEFHQLYAAPEYVIEHAHSELLEWWAETGVTGSALIGTLLLVMITALGRLGRRDPAQALTAAIALAALAAGITHGLLETKLRYESTAVPLLLILAAALVQPRPAPPPRSAGFRPLLAGCVGLALLAMSQGLLWLRANQEMKIELDRAMGNQWPAAQEAIKRAARFDPENLYIQYKHLYYRVTLNEYGGQSATTGRGPLPVVADYQDGALLLAKESAARGNYSRALDCLERYQILHPLDGRGPLVLAEVLTKAGCPRGVLEVLARFTSDQSAHEEQAVGLRAQAWMKLGWPDRARGEYEEGVANRPELIAPRISLLALALDKEDLAAAFAQITETIPRLGGRDWPPALRRLIEQFVNQVAAAPEAGKRYAVVIGDLLANAKQHQQAKIVYLRLAAKVGVAPEIVWSRVGWLGLAAGDTECLALAGRYFETRPDRQLTALYLRGRYLELTGQPEPALVAYAALLAKQPIHLGALARVAAVPAANRPPALQTVCSAAEQALGLPLQQIDATDPRWVVAALPAAADTSTRSLWITPLFPDGENAFRVLMTALASGAERYGPGDWRPQGAGTTARMTIPGPVFDTIPEGGPEAQQTLICRSADESADIRPPARYAIGPVPLVLAAREENTDTRAPTAAAGYRAWIEMMDKTGFPAELAGRLRPAIGARVDSWRLDHEALRRWRVQVGRFEQYAAEEPAWTPLARFLARPEHGAAFELFRLSCSPGRQGAAASYALLDYLVRAGMTDIPDFLWSRPYRQGLDGEYWTRWRNAAAYRTPGFRRGIAEVLLESGQSAPAIEWLGEVPGVAAAARWEMVRAWHELGRDAEAERSFAAAPEKERRQAEFQWDYGRWLLLCGKPAAEPARELDRAGAAGWAGQLRHPDFAVTDQDGEPIEYENGLVLVQTEYENRIAARMTIPPTELVAGRKLEVFTEWAWRGAEAFKVSIRLALPGTREGEQFVSRSEGLWFPRRRPGDTLMQVEISPELPVRNVTVQTGYWFQAALMHSPELALPLLPRRRELASVATDIPLSDHSTILPFGK